MKGNSNKNKSTEVLVVQAKDGKISVPNALEALNKKLDGIKKVQDTPYKTSGDMSSIGFGSVKTEMLVENLVRGLSIIIAKEDAYQKAAERLGLTSVPAFNVAGGSLEDWTTDIKLRIQIIQQEETMKKLTAARDKMAKFLSEEDQKRIVLNEISDIIGTEIVDDDNNTNTAAVAAD